MSIMSLFTFRSPEQQKADAHRYDRWAFPYGEAQKRRIAELLEQLLPEEAPTTAMAVYLIGREGYLGRYTEAPEELAQRTEAAKLLGGRNALKKQLYGKKRQLLPRYLALIIADEAVEEGLDYPSPDILQKHAEMLAKQLK